MATFPAREHVLEAALRSIEPQVDEIHLTLNEYREVPAFLARVRNLNPILPPEDLKDVGKFVAEPGADDHVFLVDDDLTYAPGYCDWLVARAETLGVRDAVFGLHGSIYRRPEEGDRKRLHYRKGLRQSMYVDQLGTGLTFALGRHVPPLDYMRGSQTFVDVRYAKWCFERDVAQVVLARPFNMARPLRPGGGTIYQSHTRKRREHVIEEIRTFAGRSARVGTRTGPKLGLFELLRAA